MKSKPRPRPLDPMKLLRACERAAERGAPFTWIIENAPRHVAMLENERRGLVQGTRHNGRGRKVDDPRKGVGKVYWSITAAGELALANARAQAARDLAERIRVRSELHS
jgi:hypothetical protein